jgi:hypothetical protein
MHWVQSPEQVPSVPVVPVVHLVRDILLHCSWVTFSCGATVQTCTLVSNCPPWQDAELASHLGVLVLVNSPVCPTSFVTSTLHVPEVGDVEGAHSTPYELQESWHDTLLTHELEALSYFVLALQASELATHTCVVWPGGVTNLPVCPVSSSKSILHVPLLDVEVDACHCKPGEVHASLQSDDTVLLQMLFWASQSPLQVEEH